MSRMRGSIRAMSSTVSTKMLFAPRPAAISGERRAVVDGHVFR
jgi:hypothetical protein